MNQWACLIDMVNLHNISKYIWTQCVLQLNHKHFKSARFTTIYLNVYDISGFAFSGIYCKLYFNTAQIHIKQYIIFPSSAMELSISSLVKIFMGSLILIELIYLICAFVTVISHRDRQVYWRNIQLLQINPWYNMQ